MEPWNPGTLEQWNNGTIELLTNFQESFSSK